MADPMPVDELLHSRSILAGYDPSRLAAGRVLVVGIGALGQNVVQNLALIGVGGLALIDFDTFEDHNATRSPFYPSRRDALALGLAKAPVAAHRAVEASTAPEPRVLYSTDLVQDLGDGILAWADVVVAAVDNLGARAWLAERCRVRGVPMVEAGFSGAKFNVAAFSGRSGEVCYRCGQPDRESSASCTQYALAAEAAQVVPAIQTTAATLAGIQTEQVIQLLHGHEGLVGRCVYGDIRVPTLRAAVLQASPDCPGRHDALPVLGRIEAAADMHLLSRAVREAVGPADVELAEPVLLEWFCTKRGKLCEVRATEAAWLRSPACTECGGPWPASREQSPSSVLHFGTDEGLPQAFASAAPAALGLRPGAALVVTPRAESAEPGIVVLEGDPLSGFREAERRPESAISLTDG